ncbi:MAG: DNA primase [Alphaproteobacteria bacterium]
MTFPPSFLDDIRARVSLEDVVGRKVKLTRKGREMWGLCPFHNEKTPSFSVSDAKGFYHCFGCGAHGDLFAFEMQTGGSSFPEAVEHFAGIAGLAMPQVSPDDRRRADRAKTLLDVTEAACAWYEGQLRGPAGAAARTYLAGRGVDEGTVAGFRLGFAPPGSGTLRAALTTGRDAVPEALMIEAGLLVQPDDGRAPYDRFRGRIMFPIGDRRGRVIAFGARAMGDAQPKYLNSPETPLFHKGHVLYGLAQAREALHGAGEGIVAEGYMDVIALHRGGFANAVAPLGTALTEDQMNELWRHCRTLILCFDGDDAGTRAAARALERLLPLIAPERRARFALLPEGQDPDDLIESGGAAAMRRVLDGALELHDALWRLERGRGPLKTPEDFADLEKRLEAAWSRIADQGLRYRYREHFRARLNTAFRAPGGVAGRPRTRRDSAPAAAVSMRAGGHVPNSRDVQERILLAAVLNHPDLLAEVDEDFGAVAFAASELDKLRQEILEHASRSGLDLSDLKSHFKACGYSGLLDRVLNEDVYLHAGFVRPDADSHAVRSGWTQTLARYRRDQIEAELDDTRRVLAENATPEAMARMRELQEYKNRIEAIAADESEIDSEQPRPSDV